MRLPLPHVRIERLTDHQVEEFLTLYSPDQGPTLWRQLEGTVQLDLLRSPFYLQLLLAQAQPGATLLQGRAALFTGFVRQALAREVETDNALFRPGALLHRLDHQRIVGREWRDRYALPTRSPYTTRRTRNGGRKSRSKAASFIQLMLHLRLQRPLQERVGIQATARGYVKGTDH